MGPSAATDIYPKGILGVPRNNIILVLTYTKIIIKVNDLSKHIEVTFIIHISDLVPLTIVEMKDQHRERLPFCSKITYC